MKDNDRNKAKLTQTKKNRTKQKWYKRTRKPKTNIEERDHEFKKKKYLNTKSVLTLVGLEPVHWHDWWAAKHEKLTRYQLRHEGMLHSAGE